MKTPTKKRTKTPAATPPAATKPSSSKPPAKKGAQAKVLTFEEKLHALAKLGDEKLGTQSVVLDDENAHEQLWSRPRHYISTRSMAVDKAMGIPGVPSGRFTEIYGPNAAGKSTLLDNIIAELQSMGGLADLADNEHARDLAYMRVNGCNLERLLVTQVRTIEETVKQLEFFAMEGRKAYGPDVPLGFFWDSIAGTPTEAELKGEVGDSFRATAAKAIRAAFRRATQVIAEHQVAFVATNQVYKQVDSKSWGDGQETYGGDGPKYAASIRLDLFPVGRIYPRGMGLTDDDDDAGSKEANKALKQLIPPAGQIVSVRVVKNKMAMPHRQRRFAIIGPPHGRGIDNAWSVWHDFAGAKKLLPIANPAIVKSGTWYSIAEDIGDYPSWQGGHWGLNELLAQHPDLWVKLVERYKELPS